MCVENRAIIARQPCLLMGAGNGDIASVNAVLSIHLVAAIITSNLRGRQNGSKPSPNTGGSRGTATSLMVVVVCGPRVSHFLHTM